MPLISHRGADSLAPENSIEGILIADSFSPSFIEIDVNCTADNALIIGHGSLKQEATGILLENSLDEYRQKYPHVALLKDVFALKLNSPFLLDIKTSDPDALDSISASIRSSNLKRFCFTSPHLSSLLYMKKHFPKKDIFVTQTYHTSPIKAVELAREHKFSGISLSKWQVNPFTMLLCGFYRKTVNVYTVDSAILMWLIQRSYKNARIITNRPQLYRRLFPTE